MSSYMQIFMDFAKSCAFFFVVTLQLLPELTTQEKGGMVGEGDA